MRKRPRLKEHEGSFYNEDYISVLPDEILVSILSRLSLKDAGHCSCLSRRRRNLWTNITSLDFDAGDKLNKIAVEPKLISSERSKYINWVNRVVRNHRGSTLEGFRIWFDFEKGSKSAIDNWVKFAIAKRVQMLELNFWGHKETLENPFRNYSFPHKILCQNKGSSLKHLYTKLPGKNSCNATGLKALTILRLRRVNVSDQALQCLLSNFPALLFLSLQGSGDLTNVKVTSMSLQLKYLVIIFCLGVETIEIYDTNLESFHYMGAGINLFINNMPMLNEVSICEGHSGLGNIVFSQLSISLHQLQSLSLYIFRPQDNIKMFTFPEHPYLKQLTLDVGAWDDDCLLDLTSLVRAFPNLHVFVLQIVWFSPSKRRRKMRRAAKYPQQYLKLVKILGYYGRKSDYEIAMYFIENAVALQTIVIDPRRQNGGQIRKDQLEREEAAARNSAKKQLEAKRPAGVELLIL